VNARPLVLVTLGDDSWWSVQVGTTVHGRILVLDKYGYTLRVNESQVDPATHAGTPVMASTSIVDGKLVLDA